MNPNKTKMTEAGYLLPGLPELSARLVRSQRKTLSICITERAEVELRAPLRLPRAAIDAFVARKHDWIQRHAAAALERMQRDERQFFGTLPLLGEEYPVRYAGCRAASFDGAYFTLPEGALSASWPAVEALYRRIAASELEHRMAFFSVRMGVTPSAMKINGASKRWGSCSGKGSLNFSWKLVLAHPDAVDYVAVHELAHILEHNHSKKFWKIVEIALPDYRRRQVLLQQAPRPPVPAMAPTE